jgi:hypothetical protein
MMSEFKKRKCAKIFALWILILVSSLFINPAMGQANSFSIKNSSGDTLLHVEEDGDVGIGVTNPTAKLDITGRINMRGNNIVNGWVEKHFSTSDSLNDLTRHMGSDMTDFTLLDVSGPVLLLGGAVHGGLEIFHIIITIDGTQTTLTPIWFEDMADDDLGFITLPPIMANESLTIFVDIEESPGDKGVGGYAWTKSLQ